MFRQQQQLSYELVHSREHGGLSQPGHPKFLFELSCSDLAVVIAVDGLTTGTHLLTH